MSLLGVCGEFDDDSEDEGVDLENDESEDEESESHEDSRLLHQLAASLTQELKQQSPTLITRVNNAQSNSCDLYQSMDVTQESSNQLPMDGLHLLDSVDEASTTEDDCLKSNNHGKSIVSECHESTRLWWSTGWNACSTEVLRYLQEVEALPAHHPTVVAMKNHLEAQRQRAIFNFAA